VRDAGQNDPMEEAVGLPQVSVKSSESVHA
jgi:hypothetical protein